MVNNLSRLTEGIGKYKGVTADSREVMEGFIFVATAGKTVDGHDFIFQAIEKGAKAVVGQRDLNLDEIPYFKVEDSREALGELASAFYKNPSEKLKVIGVTGTKGKTTTVHLIHHILTNLGERTGLISSISTSGFHVTTPDVVGLHKLLAEMVNEGCKFAVVEVSSHGIDQKRIAGVNFEVGVLTNIAPEHLDYHKTFAEYKRVKMSFINSCKHRVIAPKETKINILPGKFNNLDADAAVHAVSALGFDIKKAEEALKTFKLPEGRLTEIKNNLGIQIFIDFAHTPDSLEAALTYLKTQTKERLISVFGCAGERDVKKRRKMGRISGELADFSVFTAEDPRSEKLSDIFRLMKKDARNFKTINERGEAVAYALSIAKPGDVVGFFGKGHEKSMAFKGYEHPWSDFDAVSDYLNKDDSVSAIILAAGKGTRMKSDKPKILHEICGRPMISYSLENLRQARVGEIIAVVSYRKNLVIKEIEGAVKIAIQKNPKGGTGDAVRTGLPMVSGSTESVMVLYGDDTAFYSAKTINSVLELHKKNNNILTFITLEKENPQGLGRIIRNSEGKILEIIEDKNATEEQRKVKEVNDGLYVFDKKWLDANINKLTKNSLTGEYYINELVKAAIIEGRAMAYKLPSDKEWQGVNTPEELERAEEKMKEKLKNYHG